MYQRVALAFLLLFSFYFSFSQQLFEDRINVKESGGTDKRDAIVYLPRNYSKTKAYPLVIFTHGIGAAGNKVKRLYKEGLPKVLKQGYRPPFDFIMVAVQHGSFSVPPAWIPGILADCEKRWKIDKSRVYLTGLSAGGSALYGSQLNFTPAFAKKFAAIVANSTVTHNTRQENFKWWKQTKTPLWAIVGAADKSYVQKNAYMVGEINKQVPKLATLTVRPGVGHGGWTEVYNGKVKLDGKNMWEWLYQFKRTEAGTSKPQPEDDTVEPAEKPEESAPTTPSTPAKPETTVAKRYIKVNVFAGENPYTKANWVNWNIGKSSASNVKLTNAKYADGATSGVDAVLDHSQMVVDNTARYPKGMAPAEVLRYTSYYEKDRYLTLSGLTTSKRYILQLFGSRNANPGNSTLYTINNKTIHIKTYQNNTNSATFENLAPDSQGRIVVKIESLTQYNYLNGFLLVEVTPAK